MCEIYVQKVPKVEGFQFDGANGEEIIEWLGGPDYGVVSGDTLVLSFRERTRGAEKTTVVKGQFVVKSNVGTSVVNQGSSLRTSRLRMGA